MRKFFQFLTKKYTLLSPAAKATFWFFFCNILNKCISMLTTPIFTRLLSTDQFGIFSVFQSWNQILVILVTLRLDYGIFNKGMSKYSKNRDEYTATMQSLTSILTLVLLFVYLVFHQYINAFTGLNTLLSLGLFIQVFFFNAVSFWTLRERYDFRYKTLVFVTLSISILQTVLGIIGVILSNYNGIGRIISYLLINTCFGIFIYIHNYKKANHLFVKEYAKFAILFNIPLLPHYFSSYILDQFDRIMIQKMVGYSAVGIYGIAYSCGFVIKIISSSLNTTFIPWMFRTLEAEEFSKLKSCIQSITSCTLICFMIYMSFSPEIIHIFAPSQYYHAIYSLAPITASAFLIFLYELCGNIELFYNKNKFTMYISIIGAGLNILLNYLCIPYFGYLIAAYTTLFCYIYFSISHYIYVRKILKKNNKPIVFSPSDFYLKVIAIVIFTIGITFTYPYTFIRYGIILLLILFSILNYKKLFKFISLM